MAVSKNDHTVQPEGIRNSGGIRKMVLKGSFTNSIRWDHPSKNQKF
jgi:hypothetical protein